MEVIYIGAIVCALITAIILLRTQTTYQAYSDRLLASFLISSSFCALLYILVTTKTIINVPHLFKTAAPVNFLLPPLAYLYVRSVLHNESEFKRGDIFHWIPFAIILINYIPFYFTSSESKIFILQEIGAEQWKGTGFINENLQFLLREMQSLVYLLFQWKLIINFKKPMVEGSGAHTKQVITWIRAFNTIMSISFVSIVFAAIVLNSPSISDWKTEILQAADIVFGVGFFILCSYLLLNPSVLYGLPFLERTAILPEKINPITSRFQEGESKYETQLSQLIEYFEKEKPYLKKGLTISEIAVELEISPRNISFILNNHLGLGFNDFINQYRVNVLIEKLEDGYLESFTLESLAKEVGFSSARTLQRAFSKFHGVSPSDYVSKLVKK